MSLFRQQELVRSKEIFFECARVTLNGNSIEVVDGLAKGVGILNGLLVAGLFASLDDIVELVISALNHDSVSIQFKSIGIACTPSALHTLVLHISGADGARCRRSCSSNKSDNWADWAGTAHVRGSH